MPGRDFYARWSYEQLIVKQPHVTFEGLWREGSYYYVVCPSLETSTTASGESLDAWFHGKCRVAGAAISLVVEPPPNTEQVEERTARDAALLAGSPRTLHDVLVELCLLLPHAFPPFRLKNPRGELVFVTESALTVEQQAEVATICELVSESTPLRFEVAPFEAEKGPPPRKREPVQSIDLTPGRLLNRSRFGRDLKLLVEDDDAFWGTRRASVFTDSTLESDTVLPDHWRSNKSLRCVVSNGNPDNIRSYLSLYAQVLLVVPLEDQFDSFCKSLGLTPNELTALVAKDRVRLLVPFSIERHPVSWLNEIAEQSPANLLLSRRLAAATVLDARKRIPLLYPPLSMRDRYHLLNALSANVDRLVAPSYRAALRQFIAALAENWAGAEQFVHFRGALGTSHLGVGFIAAFLTRQAAGVDRELELWAAAQKIEWAA